MMQYFELVLRVAPCNPVSEYRGGKMPNGKLKIEFGVAGAGAIRLTLREGLPRI